MRGREPALHDPEIARRQMAIQVGTSPRTSSPSCRGRLSGSIRGPATTIPRRSGTRSFAPRNCREGDVLAFVHEVLVDVVGEGDQIVLEAELGDEPKLVALNTLPVGLCGLFTTIAFVRGVTAARSSSGSIDQSGSWRVT